MSYYSIWDDTNLSENFNNYHLVLLIWLFNLPNDIIIENYIQGKIQLVSFMKKCSLVYLKKIYLIMVFT